jgi:hypothetical protein
LALGAAAGALLQVAPTPLWDGDRWSWPAVLTAALVAGAFWLGVRLDRPDLFGPDLSRRAEKLDENGTTERGASERRDPRHG